MALLDTKEQMHLVDLPSEEELEVSDLSTIGLCYNSSLYKALATGGNVSELLVRSCVHFSLLRCSAEDNSPLSYDRPTPGSLRVIIRCALGTDNLWYSV